MPPGASAYRRWRTRPRGQYPRARERHRRSPCRARGRARRTSCWPRGFPMGKSVYVLSPDIVEMPRKQRLHDCRIEAKRDRQGHRPRGLHENSQHCALSANALAQARKNFTKRFNVLYGVVDLPNENAGVALRRRRTLATGCIEAHPVAPIWPMASLMGCIVSRKSPLRQPLLQPASAFPRGSPSAAKQIQGRPR